jgi:hypothetical protein
LDVIAALRDRGIWPGRGDERMPAPVAKNGDSTGRDRHDDDDRRAFALAIWQEAGAAGGSPVEAYLGSRGLFVTAPPSLRFHPALKHPAGGTWPAMIALVTSGIDGTPTGIHRTFLSRDGSGKAPVSPVKMMLGACRGGVVRLGDADGTVMIGEGIETCLAAMQATGRPAWAALSTSGLRSLDLPAAATDIIILADADEAGEAAARVCAVRWKREGRRVRIARPPPGMDFSDLLMSKAASPRERMP